MAENAEAIGVNKVNAPFTRTFFLAILAGAFIAFGAAFYAVVTTNSNLSEGLTKLIGGICFSMGLILVVVGGAELFTGNNLIVMAWANGKVSLFKMLKNWFWVYIGNFIGSLFISILLFLAQTYYSAGGALGVHFLNIAKKKCELGFVQAIASGVLCNILVCLAVWLCFSSKSISGKILSIIFPISAFVALGFEHSIVNLFFIPEAMLILEFDGNFVEKIIHQNLPNYASISWYNFIFHNLIPVTIGNIIGGGALVGVVYWFIYLRCEKTKSIE